MIKTAAFMELGVKRGALDRLGWLVKLRETMARVEVSISNRFLRKPSRNFGGGGNVRQEDGVKKKSVRLV